MTADVPGRRSGQRPAGRLPADSANRHAQPSVEAGCAVRLRRSDGPDACAAGFLPEDVGMGSGAARFLERPDIRRRRTPAPRSCSAASAAETGDHPTEGVTSIAGVSGVFDGSAWPAA
jgi:hypothetical protein